MTVEEKFVALAEEMLERAGEIPCTRSEYENGLSIIEEMVRIDLEAARC